MTCPRCGSRRWVGYGMWPGSGPVKRQCVPCGRVYDHPEAEVGLTPSNPEPTEAP